MFTSQAYKEPSIMLVQVKEYFQSVAKNNGWNDLYLSNVLEITDTAYDEEYSIFKYDETVIKDFLAALQNEFEVFTNAWTEGKPTNIPKYNKVMNVLSELQGTTTFIEETESISNIAEEQAIEAAEQVQKTSDDAFKKLLPFVAGGVLLYVLLPRIVQTIGGNK
jgi:hypothetical protein